MSLNLRDDQCRAVLAASPDAIMLLDRAGRIVFASEQVAAFLGYEPAELAGHSIDLVTPERYRAFFARYRVNFFNAPAPILIGVEQRLFGQHKDGREVPVEIGLSAVTLDGDMHLICAMRDTTRRMSVEEAAPRTIRRIEERLAATHAHFRQLIEHTPAAVAVFDRDMHYVFASRRWSEDYGLTGRDIIGLSHYEVFPEIPERWREAHRRAMAGEASSAEQDFFVRQDGHVEWLRWEVQPWRTELGEIGGVILFTEVITRRALAEQALRRSREELEVRVVERTRALEEAKNEAIRANARKSRFLTAASHDLRQPLQAADAYLEVLGHKLEREDQRELRDKAGKALAAMADIMQALLDIAELESGAVRPQLRDFALDEVLSRVVANNVMQAEAKGLRFVVEQRQCIAHSDPALLERVIENLVSNAIRYTDAGEVRVSVACDGERARIAVSDTGVGIPAEALETIFDEFVQLDNPARERRKGIGFGLAIAKNIATVLGCEISVSSELGRGSVFSIATPIGVGRAEALHAPAKAEPGGRSARDIAGGLVLFVDDDPFVSDAMSLLLEDAGFEVKSARNGDAALRLIAAGLRPVAIVSDFRLPGYDGAELVRRARAALGFELPAVLVTGDSAVQENGPLPNCPALHKPIDPERLIALLRQFGA